MFDKLAEKGLSLSIIVGTLLVPLTALAAIWLTDPGQGSEETSAPVTAASVMTAATQLTTAATKDIAVDLQTACGPEGMQLVSLEESESITDVQQAALDALREVCEQQGIALPSKAADPTVQTVMLATTAASPGPGSTPTTLDDDDDPGEYEYEDNHHEDDD